MKFSSLKKSKLGKALFFMLLLLAGCGNAVKSAAYRTFITEEAYYQLPVHSTPELGDYAVYEAAVLLGNRKIKGTVDYYIADMEEGAITVNYRVKCGELFEGEKNFQYIVDEQGYTLEAYYVDELSGENIPMEIASPGEAEGIRIVLLEESTDVFSDWGFLTLNYGFYNASVEDYDPVTPGVYNAHSIFLASDNLKFLIYEMITFLNPETLSNASAVYWGDGMLSFDEDAVIYSLLIDQGNIFE